MTKFYVYVDSTTEETPRPFYVGKGTKDRIDNEQRNKRHVFVSNKHGFSRSVVFTTENEIEALSHEVKLIAELHTYVKDPLSSSISANFTYGGEGVIGINERWVEQYKDGVLVKKFANFHEVAEHFGFTKSGVVSNAFSGRCVFPVVMREFTWNVEPSRKRKLSSTHGNSMIILELNPQTNEVIKEYASITEVVKSKKIMYSYLMNAIRSTNPKAMEKLIAKTGSKWAFKDEKHNVGKIHNSNVQSPSGPKPVVVVYSTGIKRIYPSTVRAAQALGINPNELLAILHGDNIQRSDFTCSFLHESDHRKDVVRSKEWINALAGINGIQIVKLDKSGNVIEKFNSISEAERREGFMHHEIYKQLRIDSVLHANGFTYKRVEEQSNV